MTYSLHNATQDAIQPILLLNYTRGCMESCTCEEAASNPDCDLGPAKNGLRVVLDVLAERVVFTAMRAGAVRIKRANGASPAC